MSVFNCVIGMFETLAKLLSEFLEFLIAMHGYIFDLYINRLIKT
jgi:hypothetical protein